MDTLKITPWALAKGDFVTIDNRWLRVLAPGDPTKAFPVIQVREPDGFVGHRTVMDSLVTVTAGKQIPTSFRPAALRRSAELDEQRADGLHQRSADKRRMADEIAAWHGLV